MTPEELAEVRRLHADQAGQIEALKEKMVKERATHIDAICKYDDMGSQCTMGETGWCVDCNQKYRIVGLARKQLAEELPEAFRDG